MRFVVLLKRHARTILLSMTLLLFSACFASNDSPQPAAAKPHIVLILADDLGWNDVGYHGSEIKTPTIDKLARSGVRLEQFYTTSLCTPTRACLMTGRHTMRYGLQTGVILPWADYGLATTERMLPQALKEAGYYTSICGKWHLGHNEPEYLPTRRGFDHAYGHYNGAIDYYTHMRDEGLDWHRNDRPLEEDGYSTTLIGREAVRVIERHDPEKPLFLYVAFNAPHQPLQAPPEYIQRYGGIDHIYRRRYAAMVTCMDDAITEILRALEKRGMVGHTLVLFLSDNGGELGIADNRPLRGGKEELYEGGIRVPALASWTGTLEPRVVDDALHAVDIYPTLLALAGAPPQTDPPLDGLDVWKTIAEGDAPQRNELLLETSELRGAIRSGPWKLVHNGYLKAIETAKRGPDVYELFNLEADPSERQNVSVRYPKIVADLKTRLDRYASQSVAPLYVGGATPPGYRAPKYWARFSPEEKR